MSPIAEGIALMTVFMTVIGGVWRISSSMAKVETKVDMLCKQVEAHGNIAERVAILETRMNQ